MRVAASCVAERSTITPVTTASDLAAVTRLCWAYRDFLLANSEIDRQITETFYPVQKYTALMVDLAQIHARPSGIILLAKDAGGVPLGCGMTYALDSQTSEIKRVFVSEAGRGTGIATRLCEALMDQAREDGFSRVVLDTSRSLAGAQRLYDKLGFAQRDAYQPIPPDVLPELLFYEKML